MRPASACRACRVQRRKCRVEAVGSACVRCEEWKLDCTLSLRLAARPTKLGPQAQLQEIQARWRGHAASHAEITASRSPETPPAAPGRDIALRRELVQHYFQVIHDTHHSIFHRPSVEEALEDGSLPDVLLYAMMALAARFSDAPTISHGKRRTRGRAFASKAMKLLDMTSISLTTIQACVLLGTICFSDSNAEAEALYYAVANRLAQIMDLPNRPADNAIQRQVNLRVWWTLYMIDIWSSRGLGLTVPCMLGFNPLIPLPAEETCYLSLRRDSDDFDQHTRGIWAEMVALARIWAEIHDLNQATVRGDNEPEALNAAVAVLASKLNNWSARLPHHLIETHQNLQRYATVGLGSAFAALHLGFHYYNEVLFYQFLASNGHSPVVCAEYYSQCCKTHAKQFCELLYTCYSMPDCEVAYVMVGHMLVVTSTVYIHILLFSPTEEETTIARFRLERNFKILTQLQTYWARLDASLSRLQKFHHACTVSIESSFRMDQWLAAFILDHGVSMHEKYRQREMALRPAPDSEASDSGSTPENVQEWYFSTFSDASLLLQMAKARRYS